MVGRFVQQEDVGVSKEGLGKKDANLEIVFNFLHLLLVQICRNAKAVQHLCCLAFGFPASHFSKLAFKFCSAKAIFLAEVFFGVDLIPLLHYSVEFLVAHDYCLQYSVFIEGKVVLTQGGHSLTHRDYDFSAVRLNLS